MAWYAHPLVIQGGLSLAGGVYRHFNPDRMRELQMEVLEDMKMERRRVHRMARGKFTGEEREQIRMGAEPGLKRLAGNIAQRGLGTSGAGAQIMAQASVAPYTQAQMAAQQAVLGMDASILNAVSMMPADNSFFDDIGAAVNAYYEHKGLLELAKARNPVTGVVEETVDEDEGLVQGFLSSFFKFLDGVQQQRTAGVMDDMMTRRYPIGLT